MPCYNGLNLTRALYASFLAFTPLGRGVELIFVDDGSSDGTSDWLSERQSQFIKVLRLDHNCGFAVAVNSTIPWVRGEFIVLLNNDLVLTPGWFSSFDRLASSWDSDVGVAGNVQLRIASGAVDHCGVQFNRDGCLVHRTDLHERGIASMPLLTGACLMLRAADFRRLGGFDPDFHNGAEDMDLCLRFLAEGRRNVLLTESIIFHHVSATRRDKPCEYANLARLYEKWTDQLVGLMAAQYDATGDLPALGGEEGCRRTILGALEGFESMAGRMSTKNAFLSRSLCQDPGEPDIQYRHHDINHSQISDPGCEFAGRK